jgi:hypothetical protein
MNRALDRSGASNLLRNQHKYSNKILKIKSKSPNIHLWTKILWYDQNIHLLLLAANCIFGFLGWSSFHFLDLLIMSCKQFFYVLYISSAISWRILMQYYTSKKKNISPFQRDPQELIFSQVRKEIITKQKSPHVLLCHLLEICRKCLYIHLSLHIRSPLSLWKKIEHLITIKLSMPIIGNLFVIFAADGFIFNRNQEYY